MLQKIVIVGAGPAGLLLAHYLLARGNYQVEIYERRPDPRCAEPSSQRTFPISLQVRGLQAIQAIPGLAKVLEQQGIWSPGALMHGKKGQPRAIDRTTPLLLLDRNQITTVLLEQLLEQHSPERLSVHFDCACHDVDQNSQTVTLHRANGEPFTVSFDRLVAADGARSQVRQVLVDDGQMQCEQTLVPDAYTSVFARRISPDQQVELAGDRIHTWSLGQGIRLLMAPQPGDWLHGTLIFPPDQNPLDSLNSGEEVLDYFKTTCPSFAPLMTLEAAEELRHRPVSRILTVKCDRMNVGDTILLLGDAVHAVSPSVGQGCNSSLQDVQVFANLLEQYQDDWSQALPACTAQRLADVHALRDLSDYTFPRSKRMGIEFILRLIVGKKLEQWMPQVAKRIVKPLPMALLMEGDLSYSDVLQQTQWWINRVRASMPVEN
ncbi:MAG: FAD-dependent oxidoreductase [Leptolyngbyaceae cyanobacterium]